MYSKKNMHMNEDLNHAKKQDGDLHYTRSNEK